VSDVLSNSRILAAYRERTKGSAELAANAQSLFPSGITHDSRYLEPYCVYIARAEGPRKWDVDGNEYVDYFGGHGALMLGHNPPEVSSTVHAALDEGTQFGASHPREVHWGRLVQELIPSAARLRFTASGTEATHMALRLARAFTARSKIARFRTNFHGWHDHVTSGFSSHFDGAPTPGVLPQLAEQVVLLPPGDLAAAEAALAADDDIAAIIIEPTGGLFGKVPVTPAFVVGLREVTTRHGVLLIFDEVVTGFRISPGGFQALHGIMPDLTTLAKILAGGLPGGAVVGREDVLAALDFDPTRRGGREKIQHQGTFNANPVSAAAGIATLEIVKSGEPAKRANAYGEQLRVQLNAVLKEEAVPWAVYGEFSGFQVFTNPRNRSIDPLNFDAVSCPYEEFIEKRSDVIHKLRLAMLVNGVDINGSPAGIISAAHGEAELTQTVAAFREALRLMKRESVI